jgi:hypothetical protein
VDAADGNESTGSQSGADRQRDGLALSLDLCWAADYTGHLVFLMMTLLQFSGQGVKSLTAPRL